MGQGVTMAHRKSAATASRPKPRMDSASPSSGDRLFDNFLPYLITRLAYRLNSDLVDKLRREEINLARWRCWRWATESPSARSSIGP